MKQRVLIIALFLSYGSFSQTKTIAHKRHNGSKLTFSESLKHEGFDAVFSNFGVAPERWVRNSELKKVVFINDSMVAMVTEESCKDEYAPRNNPEIWRAGTDTVKNHPVFSEKISVDSMRTILKETYFFANDIDKVQFEGFETNKARIPRRDLKAQTQPDETSNYQKRKHADNWSKWFLLIVATSSAIGIIRMK
ncbi:MAG: hypothetical protein WC044_04685 [Crocinitomicaceae bacterium]